MSANNARIKEKFIITANLINKSAFSISSGEGEFIDSIVVRDANDKPFIPATSLIGVIRSEFKKYNKSLANLLLGDDENPSSLALSDAKLLKNGKISTRNGIKISPNTQIAQNGALYDFEVIQSGANFSFKVEITLREFHDKTELYRAIDIFYSILKSGFCIGAKTMNGLGRIKFENLKISKYDFLNDKTAFDSYLNKIELDNCKPNFIKNSNDEIKFCLNLDIKTSLLIGSAFTQTDADIANLNENGEFLASGTSLKGAIRNRALKIAKFVGKDEGFINELFGFVDEESKNAQKSKIKIDESLVNKAFDKLHQRTKIDRFSGATIDGALFDSESLFGGDINLNICIKNPTNDEIALILLVLKDLTTGKLAVGGHKNVGRGVFEISKAGDRDENASFEAFNGNFKIYYKNKLSTQNLNEIVANLGEKL